MKLKDYAVKIAKLASQHPDAQVVYSVDSESDAYHVVHFYPDPCKFDGHEIEVGVPKKEVNAVCIN